MGDVSISWPFLIVARIAAFLIVGPVTG